MRRVTVTVGQGPGPKVFVQTIEHGKSPVSGADEKKTVAEVEVGPGCTHFFYVQEKRTLHIVEKA